jgi:hypothetical protein
MKDHYEGNIPEQIQVKFDRLQAEIDKIFEKIIQIQKTNLSGSISFKYESSVPRDILTDYERAQSVSFVTKYEGLPIIDKINISEYKGKHYVNNLDYIKHVLNDYRAIIQNKRDSVYYQKINKFCRDKLINRDKTKDLVITVFHNKDGDISQLFASYLDEKSKSISYILASSDFDYIYNGILQHSDHRFTKRYLDEYSSGLINYTFIKHAQLLGAIKECLYWHYKMLNALTSPKLGAL